jgi:Arc/MetJ-type ribon-helix-helix transcriptional regulator
MNVVLNQELEALVAERVKSGEYETPEAVVADALHLLLEWDANEIRETREAVQRALSQSQRGEGIPLEAFDQKMRSKYGIPR